MRLLAASLVSLILVVGCTSSPGPGGATPGGPTPGQPGGGGGEEEVEIVNFAYEPATLEVSAGTTVTWTNMDSADHTVTFDDDSVDSGNMANGATFEHTFDSAGEFAYHCEIHPTMTATVTVTE